MRQSELQSVLTWCHERVYEAQDILKAWNRDFAISPCATVRERIQVMLYAVAAIEVYGGMIHLLEHPNSLVTLHDLHAQMVAPVQKAALDYDTVLANRSGESDAGKIYLRLVTKAKADLARITGSLLAQGAQK